MIENLRQKFNGDIHLKEILTGSIVTFILKMSGMLLGYVIILIISRQYGAEGVGVYSLTLSLITFVAMIATIGMNVSILRYVGQFNKDDKEEHKLKLLYKYAVELVVPFSLFLAILLYCFADVIALKLFNNPAYESALEFAAFIVPFMALQNISVEFIRGLKQLKISEFLRSVNTQVVNLVFIIIFSLFFVNKLLPLYAFGIGVISSALFAIYFVRKKIRPIKIISNKDFLKNELISTSLPMMITMIAIFIMGNISLYLLETYSTTQDVGIFTVLLKISMLINLVIIVINTILAPKFSELYWSDKYQELQNIIINSSKIMLIISLSMGVLLALFSTKILDIFGQEFLVGSNSLLLLIIGQVINGITGPIGIFLNMSGHQKTFRNIVLLSSLINILLAYLLIPTLGIYGAALANMLSIILWNILSVVYIKRKIKFYIFYIPFFKNNKED